MYTFGEPRNRKQKHPNAFIPGDYLFLGSEPAATGHMHASIDMPSFTYIHRYLVKRQVMRNIRRIRRQQVG